MSKRSKQCVLLTAGNQWTVDCKATVNDACEFASAQDVINHGFLCFCRTKQTPHKIVGVFHTVKLPKRGEFKLVKAAVFNPAIETKFMTELEQRVYVMLGTANIKAMAVAVIRGQP